jgi:hypothetical protein
LKSGSVDESDQDRVPGLSQVIIFILGWPLEWTEIIVIFMPIFIPLLDNFGVDPLFFGLLVALNLQTAFLSPPVAMAAFYLKGVSPPHVIAEPDICRHAALHGHPGHRDHPAVPVPGHRPVAAAVALQVTGASPPGEREKGGRAPLFLRTETR